MNAKQARKVIAGAILSTMTVGVLAQAKNVYDDVAGLRIRTSSLERETESTAATMLRIEGKVDEINRFLREHPRRR